MKIYRKTLAALVFALTALFTAMAAISAEEYVIGEEYYKDFPGSGYQLMKVLEIRIVSNLVRNFDSEKSHISIMLR